MTPSLFKTEDSIFELKSPTTGKKIKFRRYRVKDEKNLLIAKQSTDETDIFNAILQNVQNCCLDPTFDVTKIPEFELAYYFIKIRGESVSNIIPQSYIDYEDNQQYNVNVNIADIKVNGLEEIKGKEKIAVTDTIGILMKFPPASVYRDKAFLEATDNSYQKLVVKCIDKIYTESEVHEAKDYKEEELIEWLDDLPLNVYNKIEDFVNNIPTLYYKVEYKNSKGSDRQILLTKLGDFFTLH